MIKTPKEIKDFLGEKFVLVIEPTMNYRTTIKNFFTNLKIKNFRIVGSVAEARREMLTVKVGFIICEWQLPEKNGLAFCRDLRKDKNYKLTPFLLLSTENYRDDVVLAIEGGVTGYLIKPFAFDEFCQQLIYLINQMTEPNPITTLIERSEGHLEAGEIWIAESLAKEAIALKESSARAHGLMGKIRLVQKDFANAKICFQKAIKSNPEYLEAYRSLLQIHEDQNDIEMQLEVGLLLCNLSPENPRYPLIVAKAHMEQGNLTESERFFKSSVKLSPTLSEGYKGLGSVYLRQKEYEKATKAFEKALDLEKRDIPTLNSLGMSYIKQGLFDEGIKRYLMALAIDNQDPRVLFNLGLAYEEKGTLSAAVDSFRRAIAADPSMEKAKRQLERILSESPNTATDLTQSTSAPKNPHQDFEDVSLDPLTVKKSS